MIKILVACANGAGSSLMMKMAVEKAMKQLGKVQLGLPRLF